MEHSQYNLAEVASGTITFFVPIQENADKEPQNGENGTTEQKEQSTEELSLKT
jgi:hypothetical protein